MSSLVALVVLAVNQWEIQSLAHYIIRLYMFSSPLSGQQSKHLQMLAEFGMLWYDIALNSFG